MTAEQAAYGLWIAFVVAWQASAFWVAKATSRATPSKGVLYMAGYVLGFGLLFTPAFGATLFGQPTYGLGSWLPGSARAPLWTAPSAAAWLLVLAEAAGFAFAWWARAHLGRLWSGMMTLREGHRVVDTGPYRLVRHPIYTGFIAASWSLALIEATAVSLAGAAIVTAVMAIKAKDEEGLLRRQLGAASYDAYAARTPMLAPLRLR